MEVCAAGCHCREADKKNVCCFHSYDVLKIANFPA